MTLIIVRFPCIWWVDEGGKGRCPTLVNLLVNLTSLVILHFALMLMLPIRVNSCRARNSFLLLVLVANFCYKVQDQVAEIILW